MSPRPRSDAPPSPGEIVLAIVWTAGNVLVSVLGFVVWYALGMGVAACGDLSPCDLGLAQSGLTLLVVGTAATVVVTALLGIVLSRASRPILVAPAVGTALTALVVVIAILLEQAGLGQL